VFGIKKNACYPLFIGFAGIYNTNNIYNNNNREMLLLSKIIKEGRNERI